MDGQKENEKDYDIFKEDTLTSLEVVEQQSPRAQPDTPKKNRNRPLNKRRFLIIILLALLGLTLLAGGAAFLRTTGQPESVITINTQSLDNGTLNQLTETAGGTVKQQLTISPETLFKQNVIVQGSTEVQQNLTVRGQSNLQGPVFMDQDVTIRRGLTVANNTSIGGNLSVSGSITASSLSVGSISLSTVNVSSDVTFGGHLIPNGASPTSRTSVAASGGSVTINGNDTAGTITINIGSGATLAGEMVIITFNKAFARTPKVQLTPINQSASALNYYATRSAAFFTIDTSTTPSNGASYVFDYLVTQ